MLEVVCVFVCVCVTHRNIDRQSRIGLSASASLSVVFTGTHLMHVMLLTNGCNACHATNNG